MKKQKKYTLMLITVVLVIAAVIWLAQYLQDNTFVYNLIQDFGYLAVIIVGIISGLNTFIPLPAATFTPIFVSAGLNFYLIILLLALGTLIADFVGYMLGHASKELIGKKYPKITGFFLRLRTENSRFLLPLVFLYASFAPFPNEAILIPLALSGMKFRYLLLPLILGNIVHQTIFSLGFTSVVDLII